MKYLINGLKKRLFYHNILWPKSHVFRYFLENLKKLVVRSDFFTTVDFFTTDVKKSSLLQGSCVVIFWAYLHTRLHAKKFVYTQKYTHKIDAPKSRIYDKNREKNSEKCSKIINQCKFFLCISKKKFYTTHYTKNPKIVCIHTHVYEKPEPCLWIDPNSSMASTTFGKTIYKFSDLVNRTDNLVTRTDNLVTRTDNLDRKLVTKTDNLVKAVQLVSIGFVQVDTGVYFKQLLKEGGKFMYNWEDGYAACKKLLPGAKLATLRTKQECDFVKSNTNILGYDNWLDIKAPYPTDNKNAFKNGNNGGPVDASCWENGYPIANKSKYVMFAGSGIFNRYNEDTRFNALCEYRL